MAHAKFTLTGCYDYLDKVGVDLFQALEDLPEGIDKDTLESNIILQGGEFEVLYADPYFLKFAMEPWVKKWYRTFEKWVTALNIEYDPLYNYDRTEEYTDTHTGTVSDAGSGTSSSTNNITRGAEGSSVTTDSGSSSNTRTDNLTETNEGSGSTTTNATHSGQNSNETINQVSAYDVNDFANANRTTSTGSDSATDTTTTTTSDESEKRNTGTVQDAGTTTGRSATEEESSATETAEGSGRTTNNNLRTHNLTDHHTARLYGNIGVTTSQQMLESELDIAKWNLYEHITDLFIEEFTIPVYI